MQRDDLSPTFVAEISGNHNGDFTRALALVDAASKSGATAVKFQTYKPETMTLPMSRFAVSEGHPLWGGMKLFDLYRSAMTPWEWHKDLFEYAREKDIVPFSSPFDRTAVDFLEDLNCGIYKIASLETGDVDLIRYAANTGKPLMISTGASTLQEIEGAVDAARLGGCHNLTLLLCTSAYPTRPSQSHISRMKILRSEFGLPVGISDHTLGIGTSIAAVGLGAICVEKHLTLKRSDGGPDAAFSLEPDEFEQLVQEGCAAFESIGEEEWIELPAETESRKLRRSLFITKDVKRGEIANRENVKPLRPNLGGSIYNLEQIIGMKFRRDYAAGSAAHLDCFE